MPLPASKITKKRELPQPTAEKSHLSKKKALSDKTTEIPSKPLMPTASSRSNITGTSLIGASGLKAPSTSRVRPPARTTRSANGAKSAYGGIERPGPYDRPKTAQSTRTLRPRTRSQVSGRPLTALSARSEPTPVEPVASAPAAPAVDEATSAEAVAAENENEKKTGRPPMSMSFQTPCLIALSTPIRRRSVYRPRSVKPRISSLSGFFASLSLKEDNEDENPIDVEEEFQERVDQIELESYREDDEWANESFLGEEQESEEEQEAEENLEKEGDPEETRSREVEEEYAKKDEEADDGEYEEDLVENTSGEVGKAPGTVNESVVGSSVEMSSGPETKPPSMIPPPPVNVKLRRLLQERDPVTPMRIPVKSANKSYFTSQTPASTFKLSTFDVDNRLVNIEQQFSQLKTALNDTVSDRSVMETTISMLKSRITEQEAERERNEKKISSLEGDVEKYREEANQLRRKLEEESWQHKTEIESLSRANKHAKEDLERTVRKEADRLKAVQNEEIVSLKRKHHAELDDERKKRNLEVAELKNKLVSGHKDLESNMSKKNEEMAELRSRIELLKSEVTLGNSVKSSLQANIAQLSAANVTLEAKINSLRSQIDFLESDSKAQSDSFAAMETKLQEALKAMEAAKTKLHKEETERRILFNKYQELKGNIRVMCRVRPVVNGAEGEVAQIEFPDADQSSAKISVMGPEEKSSLGYVTRKDYPFEFDRVFSPAVKNDEIFDEISQLVQSALDGYNVCIFCYGQTGSGKTYTMSSPDGMIPRATHMIYDTVTKLKEKSWSYTMEGCFIEVYNEELNDLLTPADPRAKRLDIRHDEFRKQTTVVNCKTVRLTSPENVEQMLAAAQRNRSVAATKANERSSRSHSVFILKLLGENAATGERCEGTLNLVDLAGSERLKHSQAEGERMKETQNINKSLSCLGDVIDALGRGSSHVPYRNSKLTHLLQYSLGGNSKTLMFVMMSPLEAHLKETLTSLRFAAKVHNTHIGTAKATKKLREA
ncbi:hypothetical protein TD95_003318 [Thielaviopsis punctulata]|uniref:Kinesin motor domain-containing protein n=1 Tax=Thielaviopsis punctulata TaxID=72032 RepID=A0A0F4ZDJ7_9PEZI|nr:hypothetical protein TD95_003318 [Thielaviopsis punctulata]